MNFLFIFIAYIIGAIPTGFIIARCAGIADITQHGSGNIGATNVARVAGKHYFLLVFLVDAAKAFLYLLFLQHYHMPSSITYLAAAALLVGNSISVFLGGKGGKGVATAIGIMAGFNIKILCLIFLVWLCSFIKTRTVGISSVVALFFLPFVAFLFELKITHFLLLSIFISCWGIWRHATNIKQFFKVLKPTT